MRTTHTRRIPAACALTLLLALPAGSPAHPGALDGNGCHYDTATGRYHCHRQPKKNPDVNAPAKKSRGNVCHDARSPNYSTLKYFVSYPSLQACLTSGGRASGA
jgi:hypothetical protein